MLQTMRSTILTAITASLFGCASTNFVRPDLESLHNGKTTYVQVTAMMGKPRHEGVVIKNDKTLTTAAYAYASNLGQPLHPNGIAVRAITFYFYNEMLVGHAFVSSWAEDHTDFDEGKLTNISKGKTTRAEVLQLLGKPSGYFIYPLIKESTGEAAAYVFSETRYAPIKYKFYRKELVVTFDTHGVVTDVEFVSSGSK
jgi:outer membrane protein assembly factor BamE (lipoprotein component of BamABCDE complex)